MTRRPLWVACEGVSATAQGLLAPPRCFQSSAQDRQGPLVSARRDGRGPGTSAALLAAWVWVLSMLCADTLSGHTRGPVELSPML